MSNTDIAKLVAPLNPHCCGCADYECGPDTVEGYCSECLASWGVIEGVCD